MDHYYLSLIVINTDGVDYRLHINKYRTINEDIEKYIREITMLDR